MRKTRFPPGWDEERVLKVLQHYQEQSEEEAVAEDEEALEAQSHTIMEIPRDLVPKVRALIAERKS